MSESELRRLVAATQWDFLDADTRALTHNIHRYSGKFIPQVAAKAIELVSSRGDTVLDPFCGSGTTLVESALAGRSAIGIDLSPLAVLISATKVTPIPSSERHALIGLMSSVVGSLTDQEQAMLWPSATCSARDADADPRMRDPWFVKWFERDVLRDLIVIDAAIQGLPAPTKRLATVALSNILRRSSRAHSGYPNVMFDRKAPPRPRPGQAFLTSLRRASESIGALEQAGVDWSSVSARTGDATALDIPDRSIDAIVSHPPYIGSVPYAEYGLLSLKWLGVDPKEIDAALIGGRRQSRDVVDRFRASYGRMLSEAARVLKPGRYMFLMVGNPVVRGETVDLREMTQVLAGDAGFELVAETSRFGSNRRANKMGHESLLFFQASG